MGVKVEDEELLDMTMNPLKYSQIPMKAIN